jgi:hypothetical protein
LPDRFVEHGPVAELRERCGLSVGNVKSVVRGLVLEMDAAPHAPAVELVQAV